MNNIHQLIIISFFLISCSGTPSAKSPLVASPSTPGMQTTHAQPTLPIDTPTPAHTLTPKQSSTYTAPATATTLPTYTITPSTTPTPTEDLSFFSILDCIPKDTPYQRATVTNVIDGDTIEVLLQDGTSQTVRYIGIDSPENDFPYFTEARQANFDLVSQKEVMLVKDRSEVDQYGRMLRYVIAGQAFVNLEMVKAGFAKAENYPPDTACSETFASAEAMAREAFAGMWVATATPEITAAQVTIVAVNKREEWVDIKNTGSSEVDLTGWNLVSERGHQDCPLSGPIAAGETIRIWAMTAQGEGYSCGYGTNIWNNSEPDPAVLYNPQGVEVSRK